MDSLSIIVHAIIAGARFVADKGASEMIKDAYSNLKKRLLAKVDSADVQGPAAHETLEDWSTRLAQTLKMKELDKDPAVVAAAQTLLAVIDRSTKYSVNVQGGIKTLI